MFSYNKQRIESVYSRIALMGLVLDYALAGCDLITCYLQRQAMDTYDPHTIV